MSSRRELYWERVSGSDLLPVRQVLTYFQFNEKQSRNYIVQHTRVRRSRASCPLTTPRLAYPFANGVARQQRLFDAY